MKKTIKTIKIIYIIHNSINYIYYFRRYVTLDRPPDPCHKVSHLVNSPLPLERCVIVD